MAITAQNASYSGQGPTDSGQVIGQSPNAGNFAKVLVATATFTGDGSTTTAKLNYIDGTKTLGFTPKGVIGQRQAGNTTATISIVSVVDDANGATATVTFSAAPTNSGTLSGLFVIFG